MGNKYKFYYNGNEVIAVSTFAGKTIKAKAKCNPEDVFDVEKGKQLAAARCNLKIAKKREDRADYKLFEAETAYDEAEEHYIKMKDYSDDSYKARIKAEEELDNILKSL